MPLRDQVVDIFLTGPDQLPSDHQGGIGRMTDLRNAEMVHFDPANPSKPQFLGLKQRKGFRSLVTTGHSAATGTASSPAWAGARLLTTTGNGAPLAIIRSKPRVYDGTDWATYESTRVITNKTTARPVYSEQSVAQAPDKSWLAGVTCRAWTEVTNGANVSSTSISAIVAGFRADNGAWIRKPFVLQATAGAGYRNMARVVNDGTNFWVFATDHNGGSPKIRVFVYDSNGQQLATNNVDMKWTVFEPGYWDVQRKPGTSTILLAQPNGTNPAADNHVLFSAMTYAASAITIHNNADTNIHCNGPLAWLTNFQDSNNYLATTSPGEAPTVALWAYKVELTAGNYLESHEYNFGIFPADTPDTLIGYTEASTDSTSTHKNVVVSFGIPAGTTTYGANYDPSLRYIKSYRCDWANAATFLRQTNSVCQVSRAFAIDDDYYAWTYYQSGSGEADPSTESVTLQANDYFYGAAEQKLDIGGANTAGTTGSPVTFAGTSVFTTNAAVAHNIAAGDTVVNTVVPPGLAAPAGTACLHWTLANSTGGAFTAGSRLDVNGNTDYPAINTGQWLVLCMGGAGPSNDFYTLPTSTAGGTVPDLVFTASGTVTIVSMTKYVANIGSVYDSPSRSNFLPNGTLAVTGNGNANNNGTKTIDNAVSDGIWIVTGSEGTNSGGFTGVVTPAFPNRWFFDGAPGNHFDDSYIGTTLVFDGAANPANDGSFPVTGVTSATRLLTAGETTLLPEYFFNVGLMSAKILLAATQVPYTFHIQSATFDYSYIGAIVSFGNPTHTDNAGLYKITQIVDSHTVITVPVSTVGTPHNESLLPDTQDINILKTATTFPQIQPQWFLTPLGEVTTSQVGNLELGLAYADWRREGMTGTIGGTNPYPLHVSSPCIDNDGYTTDLPFRAVTVSEQSATVIGGLVSTSAIAAAVVGVKDIKVYSAKFGQPCNGLIPGAMASVYDGGNFVEADILIGLEQPTLLSEQVASNPALQKNSTMQYVACLEAIDGTGNRIWTAPTPPLNVTLTGTNTSATICGRLPIPLGSDGTNLAYSSHFGLSNRPMLVLSIYRTCVQNGLQTTARYKITDDLAPNATTPISATNDSGFSFPDEFTWTYKDENLDSVVLSNEKLYTDQGSIPRFHPPAFNNGAEGWQERDWLNAYDGAVWFSGAQSEGEAVFYNPLYRIPMPFEPTAIANLESFLAGFALDTKWYLPAFQPPLNNGNAFKIPAWQRLSLEGGCTGIVLPIRGGVAYSSNFGGVWFLSRNLQDEWTSRDYIDTMDGKTITAMAVDAKQRLHVLTNSTDWFMYDQVAKRWSRWIIGDALAPKFATVCAGNVYYQSQGCVAFYDTSLARDSILGVDAGVPLGFTTSSLNFGNVAGIKRLRQIQLNGRYKGEHKLAVAISYPDQNPTADTTTMQLFTPDPTKPYDIDAYPLIEEASSYGLTVDASFSGVTTPGDSFELDVVSALVAVDGRAGINRSTQQISNG